MWSFKGTTDNMMHRIPNNEDKKTKKNNSTTVSAHKIRINQMALMTI